MSMSTIRRVGASWRALASSAQHVGGFQRCLALLLRTFVFFYFFRRVGARIERSCINWQFYAERCVKTLNATQTTTSRHTVQTGGKNRTILCQLAEAADKP